MKHQQRIAVGNDCSRIVDAMQTYRQSILAIPTSYAAYLETLVVAIGDSSSLLLLKQAYEGLRSAQHNESLTIDQQLTTEQRVEAINRLASCSFYHRLLRWFHIVVLCEHSKDDNDIFLNLDPSCITDTNPAPFGNPRSAGRSELHRRLKEGPLSLGGAIQADKASTAPRRLHRIGKRLCMMIERWGYAVLLLLGSQFAEEK